MTHVISATYNRFDRMSPTAAALAVLLHLATALALWWVSPLNHRTTEVEDRAIDVTIEKPAPAPPEAEAKPTPPPAPPKPSPPKAAPAPLGLSPPSPTIADTPKQVVPTPETRQLALPPAQQEPQPDPQTRPSPPLRDRQQALAPQEAAPPLPLERSLPPLEAPPPPLTSKDFPKAPRAQPPARPQVHVAPPAAPHHQQLRPSPLSSLPQRQAPADPQATAPSATFVNPADQYSQARAVDQYLWTVANKISQYRYHSNEANEQGTVVLRLVISRDGRLLDVSIARSSGMVNLDRGLIEAARAAAPYAPLPNVLHGPQVAFTLPFASVYRRR